MNLKELISEIVLVCHNEGGVDGTTMKNILYYLEDFDEIPKSLDDCGTLISSVVANEIDLIIRTTLAQETIELTDEQFDSMIDGELYEYYTSEYVCMYYQANLNIIHKYVDNWDKVKPTFEMYSGS